MARESSRPIGDAIATVYVAVFSSAVDYGLPRTNYGSHVFASETSQSTVT